MVGELPIRDELRVHVDERIGAEAGGEDVGVRLSEFLTQGADVQIRVHDLIEGGVESESVGRPLVVEDRIVDGRGWTLTGLRGHGHRERLGKHHAPTGHHR